MDEDSLGAALHRATDDVEVPRDLVRQAQRLGRERRARRRSGVAALAVAAVVLVGGGLVVTSQRGGGSDTSASSAAAGSSAEGGPGVDAGAERSGSAESAPTPAPPSPAAPEPMQDAAPPNSEKRATCDPTLVVDGVPQGAGTSATPVRAGEVLDVAGGPLSCEGLVPGARYDVVLMPQGAGETAVLAGVTVADDGSFATRVTVPASTPTGPAALSVTVSGAAACPSAAGCEVPSDLADLDVRPAEQP